MTSEHNYWNRLLATVASLCFAMLGVLLYGLAAAVIWTATRRRFRSQFRRGPLPAPRAGKDASAADTALPPA